MKIALTLYIYIFKSYISSWIFIEYIHIDSLATVIPNTSFHIQLLAHTKLQLSTLSCSKRSAQPNMSTSCETVSGKHPSESAWWFTAMRCTCIILVLHSSCPKLGVEMGIHFWEKHGNNIQTYSKYSPFHVGDWLGWVLPNTEWCQSWGKGSSGPGDNNLNSISMFWIFQATTSLHHLFCHGFPSG